jgi:hypothetical protein
MKTALPLVLGFVAGWFGFSELYIEHEDYRSVFEVLSDFTIILAAMAYVLGGINIVQVNWPKIRRREADWQYKVLLLVGAAVMLLAGAYPWHTLGGTRESGRIETTAGAAGAAGATTDGAILRIAAAHDYALVALDGGAQQRAWHGGDPADLAAPPGSIPLELRVPPGKHTVTVTMPVAGYTKYEATFTATAGDSVSVTTNLVTLWGAKSPDLGRVYVWFYDHVFFPCNATMFALLAFFIASAAFRAFRARSAEAALLLGAAVLVMIGFVPMGGALWSGFPEIADWIMEVLNTSGRRAIIMGAALGAVATGLRIILGIERSHLGSE